VFLKEVNGMPQCLMIALLSVVLLASSSGASQELTGTVSLEECLQTALKLHPALAGADAEVQAAHQRVRQAASGFLPRVEGEYSFTRQSRTVSALIRGPSGPTETDQVQTFNFQSGGFSIEQRLFAFGQTLNATRSSQANAEAVEANRTTTEHDVALGVKRAYYGLIAFHRLLGVATEQVANTTRHLDEARGRHEIGVAPRFDVTQQEVQVANAELDEVVAQNNVELGRENLRNAMGLKDRITFTLKDTMLDYQGVRVGEEEAVERAYAARPEVSSVNARLRAQTERISELQKEQLPIAVGVGNYSFTGNDAPEDEGWLIGARIRLMVFNGGLTRAQIGEGRAERLRLEANLDELRQNIALEVRQSWLTVRAAEASIRVTKKAKDAATENLHIAEGRYAAGAGNVIELTDAQLELTQARANQVRALTEYWIARAELEHAIGVPELGTS
jgi:outer membrane protein